MCECGECRAQTEIKSFHMSSHLYDIYITLRDKIDLLSLRVNAPAVSLVSQMATINVIF